MIVKSKSKQLVRKWEYVYYNKETGEKVENPTKQQIKNAEDEGGDVSSAKFFKGFVTLATFLKAGNLLTKTGYIVLLYMLIFSGYDNKIAYSRNKIAKLTGICPKSISLAVTELTQLGFCVKINSKGLCLLNPYYSFRGTDSQHIQKWYNTVTYQQHHKTNSEEESESTSEKRSTTSKKRQSENATGEVKSKRKNARRRIIAYVLEQKDVNNAVHKQVNEMVNDLQISKVTIIPILKSLESDGYISRPARGHVKLLRVNDLKRLLR